MHAININPLQAGALLPQAQAGALTTAPLDGAQFSCWLSPPGPGRAPADLLPETSTMAPPQPAVAQAEAAATEMLQALCRVLCSTVSELLDAGAFATAAVPASQQEAPAKETAEPDRAVPDRAVPEPAAGANPALKPTAVLWSRDVQDTAALPAAAKVATAAGSLQYLLERWPQLEAQLQSGFAHRFGLALSLAPAGLSAWAANPAAVPWSNVPAIPGGAPVQLPGPLQAWLDQSGTNPQQLPLAVHGSSAAPLDALPENMSHAPASIRWFAAGGKVADPAHAAQPALPQPQMAAATVQLADGNALRLAVAADSPAGQPGQAGFALQRPGGSPDMPAGSVGATGQLVPAASGFTVALFSPAEELPLLTARLVVEPAADPALPLPAIAWPPRLPAAAAQSRSGPAAPASQPQLHVAPAGTELAAPGPSREFAGSTAVVGGLSAQSQQQAAQASTATQPALAAAPAADGTQAHSLPGHDSPLARDWPEAPAPAEVRPTPLAEALSQVDPGTAAGPRYAAARQSRRISMQAMDQIAARLTARGPAVTLAHKPASQDSPAQAMAELHSALGEQLPTPAPHPEPRAGTASAPGAAFTPLGADLAAVSTPGWDAAPAYSSQPGGLVLNQLPVQLMQFSSRELTLRPYAGLEFHELAGRLLEHAAAARSQGDGLYRLTLELNPPSLGRMSVNIAVRGDNVALQLAVASAVPREQLKGNLAALRQSLEEAGLNVVELRVVTVDPDGQPARQYREQQPQPQPETAADDEALRLAFSQALSAGSA